MVIPQACRVEISVLAQLVSIRHHLPQIDGLAKVSGCLPLPGLLSAHSGVAAQCVTISVKPAGQPFHKFLMTEIIESKPSRVIAAYTRSRSRSHSEAIS